MKIGIQITFRIITIVLVLLGCEPSGKRPSDMSPQELVKSREVRKVSDIDILEAARIKGSDVVSLAKNSQKNIIESILKDQSIVELADSYNSKLLLVMDSIEREFKVEMKRVPLLDINKKIIADSEEQQLLEAYAFNVENNIPTSESVNIMADGKHVLYTKPMLVRDVLCMNCHEMIDDQTREKYDNIFNSSYPELNDFDLESDRLYGMWSVKLSKKEIITSME